MPTLANSGLTQTSLSLCSWLNSSNVICSICRIRNSLERTRIRSGRLVAARIDALGGVGSETLVRVQAMVGSVGSRLNAMSKRQFPVAPPSQHRTGSPETLMVMSLNNPWIEELARTAR